MVVLVDRWLGRLLDALDRHGLWDETMVIFTSDHGTFNGDHGRTGKFHEGTETHNHDACAHIPFVVSHPEYGQGERRDQLVQLVDVYPTVLNAVGRPCPPDRLGLQVPAAELDGKGHDVLAPAGSVIFFSSLLVHSSRPNASGRPRRLMIYSHYPADDGEGLTPDERNGPTRLRESPYEWEYQYKKKDRQIRRPVRGANIRLSKFTTRSRARECRVRNSRSPAIVN